ncbi:SANT/Myb domain-containing protein [Ochrobactrum teleogrylli]|uniref:SANT/Myb domain-containing protein n=2 Tax=Ochrobactrum teleogrylli TaxID=2479765 RepID=A0ABY2Y2U9_9HYPH|nr:SANT/Myb domain-containing protein [[Ochrobactrum] teleogrylli]
MYLSDYSQNANRAQQARRRIRYLGVMPNGSRLWTPDEDQICRQYGTNYSVLMEKLPHRTYLALRSRCQKLGLRPKRQLMTAAELSKLRRLGPTAPADKLLQEFPTRTLAQLHALRKHYKISRPKPPLVATGYPILDAIRQRCAELNYSMVDLDALAHTKRYFQNGGWHSGGINYKAVCKAIVALDGEISVCWRGE